MNLRLKHFFLVLTFLFSGYVSIDTVQAQCTVITSAYIDLEDNLPCETSCGTPISSTYEVWRDEGYITGNLVAGSEYDISLSTPVTVLWNPTITFAEWDGTNVGAVVGFVDGRNLSVTIPTTGNYIITITETGNCTGAGAQNEDNGILTVDCGAGGATCYCLPSIGFDANYNCSTGSVEFNVTSVDAGQTPYDVTIGGSTQSVPSTGLYTFAGQPDDVQIEIEITPTNGGCQTGYSSVYADECDINCSGGTDPIADGGFEGSGWTETSLVNGSPSGFAIVDGTFPFEDTQSAFLGGFADISETSVEQSVTINSGLSAMFSFWMIMAACDSPSDYVEVTVDGNSEFTVNAGNAFCGDGLWHRYEVDLSAYADNNSHDIAITAYTFADNGGHTNFFVDKVFMEVCPCPTITLNTSTTDATCTASNGTATVTPSNGTAPYTFLWSDGQTTATANNMAAGTYSVTVTDDNGCSESTSVTVNSNNTTITASSSTTDASCGANDGTASVTPTNGTSPYTYLWSNGQTTQTATSLASGTYNVTITDANGCTGNISGITVNNPGGPSATDNITDVTCNGGSDGEATANATGGAAPYTYMWSDGQTTATATGLSAGPYTCTVTDDNGCTFVLSVTVNEPSAVSGTTTVVDASCNGGSDGEATVTASGGTAPYTYSWSDGQTTATASGLSAGSYDVTITDDNGCTGMASATVGEATPLVLDLDSVDVSTAGGTDGEASVSVSGGTAPYTYSWNNGGTLASISGLSAGTYTVTVTDANGCEATGSIIVNDGTVGIFDKEVLDAQISIRPNPAQSKTFIDVSVAYSGDLQIEIMNISGQVIYQKNVKHNKSSSYPLDISSFASGTYLVNVRNADFVVTKKLVVNR